MANKHESMPSWGPTTGLMLDLVKNHSTANLYILPRTKNVEVGAIVDRWNYPVKYFELHQSTFLKLILNKEIHVRQSTEGSPCTDLEEGNYYQVS